MYRARDSFYIIIIYTKLEYTIHILLPSPPSESNTLPYVERTVRVYAFFNIPNVCVTLSVKLFASIANDSHNDCVLLMGKRKPEKKVQHESPPASHIAI